MIGRALTPGSAAGAILKLDMPLSFWGGVDLESGTIVDRSHPRCGVGISRRILCMPGARGSSSSSSALVELARGGVAPAAIVMQRHDPILVIGSLVTAELYNHEIPIILLGPTDWACLHEGDVVQIHVIGENGIID